jgi:hypothetical protein
MTRAALSGEAGIDSPLIGLNPLVTDQRGNTERWLGMLLDFILRRHDNWSPVRTDCGPDEVVSFSFPGEWLARASVEMIDHLGLVPARRGSSPTTPPRLRCDESDRSVYLDGDRKAKGLEPDAFTFFRAVATSHPAPITFKKIQSSTKGLNGKNPSRLKAKLPPPLCDWLKSGGQGYYLELPKTAKR